MTSQLQPLLDRNRYSDEEWELASAGRCPANTANYPRMEWCGKPSDPSSFYRECTEHDQEKRDEDAYLAQWGHPPKYGK